MSCRPSQSGRERNSRAARQCCGGARVRLGMYGPGWLVLARAPALADRLQLLQVQLGHVDTRGLRRSALPAAVVGTVLRIPQLGSFSCCMHSDLHCPTSTEHRCSPAALVSMLATRPEPRLPADAAKSSLIGRSLDRQAAPNGKAGRAGSTWQVTGGGGSWGLRACRWLPFTCGCEASMAPLRRSARVGARAGLPTSCLPGPATAAHNPLVFSPTGRLEAGS